MEDLKSVPNNSLYTAGSIFQETGVEGVSLQWHKGQRYSVKTRKQKFAFRRNNEIHASSFFTAGF